MDADKPESIDRTEVIRESRLRSVLKALSWRVLATLTTIAIAYFIVGDVTVALKIGAVEVVAKMLIYYLHERAWAKVPLGTVRAWAGAEKS
ncbi:MAG: DUF2061 domain-containing protein [Verrucomicrobiota bacterium]|nr:DUF2061 domain-containing protein [Verrucomicrobiota bacterium]